MAEEPSQSVVEPDDDSDEPQAESASSAGNATVADEAVERGVIAATPGSGERSLATQPSGSSETAATPLAWCLASRSGLEWQEANAGLTPQHRLSSDTGIVYHGSASARLGAAGVSLPLETVAVMWQAVAAEQFRGKRVEVSAYARPRITRVGHFFVRTQGSGPAELWLSDQGTAGAKGINQYIPRDAEWDRYRVVHDVPADAEVMYFGFALFGGGHLWIDDVRISIVDNASPLSHYGSVAGNPNIAIDPSWILPEALNLDFEYTSDGPTGGEETSAPSCTRGAAA